MKKNLLSLLLNSKNRIYLILIYIPCVINAQQEYDISIPSPNAAAFTNQIDVPVSQFTGSANYSIPIYNIQEGNINLPINLSYSASGFKPNVHPGWVGSGFSLNAGGAITRKVRGVNDDLFELSGNQSQPILSSGYFYSNLTTDITDTTPEKFRDLVEYDFPEILANDFQTIVLQDIEPDDFYFNFGPYSGKFIFDKQMTPIVVSNNQNLRVEIIGLYKEKYSSKFFSNTTNTWVPYSPNAYSFSGFRIITSDGTIYEFGSDGGTVLKNVERSQSAMSIGTRLTNDAWYLSKIISSSGEELASFEYLQNEWYSLGNGLTRTNELTGQARANTYNFEPIRQLILTRSFVYNNQPEVAINLPLSGKIIHPCYLSNISTKKSNISFHTSISTELQHHPKDINLYLDNAYGEYNGYINGNSVVTGNAIHDEIRQRMTDNYGESQPTINWMQLDSITIKDKTPSPKTIKTSRFYYTHNKYERLRLLKYQENDVPPYLFGYLNLNNRFIDGIELGNYGSFGNWWYGTTAVDNLGFFKGDITSSTIAIGNYLRGEIKKTTENTPGYYHNYVPYSSSVYSTLGNSDANNYNFTGNGQQILEQDLVVENEGTYFNEQALNFSINTIHTPMGGRIEFEYEPHTTTYAIDRNNVGEVSIENRIGNMSGIRVKSIKTYDSSDETKFLKRNFEYDMGILFYKNKNFKKFHYSYLVGGGASIYTFAEFITSFSLNSFVPGATNDDGSYIGYSKVSETITNPNGEHNGKIINYYSNYKDHPDLFTQTELDQKKDEHLDLFQDTPYSWSDESFSSFPMFIFPVTSLDMNRGKPLHKITLDQSNNILEETHFEYTDPDNDLTDNTPLLVSHLETADIFLGDGIYGSGAGLRSIFLERYYEYYYHPSLLKKKTTTQYFNEESITNEVTYNYFYNHPHNQIELTSTNSINSTGDTLTTSYTYPSNYGTDIYEDMWSKNIVSPVITTTVKKGDKIIGGSLNTYRTGEVGKGESLDQFLLDKSYQLLPKTTLPSTLYNPFQNIDETIWDENVELVTYDTDDNLLQYREDDNINISYIYGYNNTLPIAKIENITYSELSNTVDISALKALSNADDDHGIRGSDTNEDALRTALDALRGISGVMATTYTYDPLIGLTSQTDINGRTLYYDYDAFGRLKYLKDQDGKIVKKYQYNYKNSN